jgi:hypothetical protein
MKTSSVRIVGSVAVDSCTSEFYRTADLPVLPRIDQKLGAACPAPPDITSLTAILQASVGVNLISTATGMCPPSYIKTACVSDVR